MGKCLEINIEDVQTRLQGALENYFDENEVLQNSPALIQDIVDFYFSLKETNSIPEDPEQLDNLVNSIWEIFYQYGLTSLGEVFYSQETILTYLKNILTENINERLASVSRLVDTDVELSIMNLHSFQMRLMDLLNMLDQKQKDLLNIIYLITVL